MSITRENPLPLYHQLKEAIVEKVENGEWLPGNPIPTELELQKTYKLSRTTVRQALGELVAAGTLTRMQGKGTFVAEPKLEAIRPAITSFTHDMSEKGYMVSSIVLECGDSVANSKIQRLFQLGNDTHIFQLNRIRLVQGVPIAIQHVSLNIALTPAIHLEHYDFSQASLYRALAHEGVHLWEAEETVEPELADPMQAELLQIPLGALLLSLTRVTNIRDGRPFEYAQTTYRADKYKYSIKLR
jgi:GntR family transcriptional regulator